jgi:hypothetical protein
MANRYWVGGTAAWDGTAGTKWALTSGGAGGQAVPTSSDDVFFTNLSTGTCTISTGNTGAKSVNCTGFTGTLAGTASIGVSGSLTLVSGMTLTGTIPWSILATGTLITGGKTLSSVDVDAPGGTVTLGSALTLSNVFSVNAGTFTTSVSNYALTTPALFSSNSNTRSILFNGSTVTLNGTGYSIDFTDPTGLTFTAGTSSIVHTGASAFFRGGGKTFNNVSFTNTAFTNGEITGSNTFTQLTLTAPTAAGISPYGFFNNQTIITLVASGTSSVNRIFLLSNTLGTARTITATTWTTVTDVDFRDITLTSAKSGTRLGDAGGNTNITFDAAKTVYWNLAGAQNWSATGWATSSGGSPAINNFPLAQDTAVFDNTGSVTGAITVNSAWNIASVDMSARTSAMTLTLVSGTNSLVFYGNLVTGSGTTFSGTGRFVFSGRVPQTITSAGKTVTQQIEIASAGSTVTLQDALTVSVIAAGSILLTSGTFDLGGYNVTVTSGSFNGDGTTARTLAFGTSVFTVGSNFDTSTSTNLTVTGSGTIRLTSASQKTFASGSADYSGITIDQAGAGLLVFGNAGTLGNISNSYASTGATSIRFDQDQTVGNFTASGQVGRVLTITSSTNGVARTLTKTSGIVSVNYLNIRDSTATGGATWYAGANSVNTSNNTGWIFTNAPGGGNFIAFFM